MFKCQGGTRYHQIIFNSSAVIAFKAKPTFATASVLTLSILILFLFAFFSISPVKADKYPWLISNQTIFSWQHKNTVESIAVNIAQVCSNGITKKHQCQLITEEST